MSKSGIIHCMNIKKYIFFYLSLLEEKKKVNGIFKSSICTYSKCLLPCNVYSIRAFALFK